MVLLVMHVLLLTDSVPLRPVIFIFLLNVLLQPHNSWHVRDVNFIESMSCSATKA